MHAEMLEAMLNPKKRYKTLWTKTAPGILSLLRDGDLILKLPNNWGGGGGLFIM